jgi:hypothetical protein
LTTWVRCGAAVARYESLCGSGSSSPGGASAELKFPGRTGKAWLGKLGDAVGIGGPPEQNASVGKDDHVNRRARELQQFFSDALLPPPSCADPQQLYVRLRSAHVAAGIADDVSARLCAAGGLDPAVATAARVTSSAEIAGNSGSGGAKAEATVAGMAGAAAPAPDGSGEEVLRRLLLKLADPFVRRGGGMPHGVRGVLVTSLETADGQTLLRVTQQPRGSEGVLYVLLSKLSSSWCVCIKRRYADFERLHRELASGGGGGAGGEQQGGGGGGGAQPLPSLPGTGIKSWFGGAFDKEPPLRQRQQLELYLQVRADDKEDDGHGSSPRGMSLTI